MTVLATQASARRASEEISVAMASTSVVSVPSPSDRLSKPQQIALRIDPADEGAEVL